MNHISRAFNTKYKILNCKEKLYQWKITETNMCDVYREVDGIEAHLFYCIESKNFWSKLKTWMIANLNFDFE